MKPQGPQWVAEPGLPHGLSAQDQRLDAYLVWDLFTDFRRHASALAASAANAQAAGKAARWLPLIVELSPPAAQSLAQLASDSPALADLLSRWANPADAALSAIQTGIVPESLIGALARAVAQGSLQCFQLGAPCGRPTPTLPVPRPGPLLRAGEPLHTLGVIDDGCCLAHQDFRNAAQQSRVLWLWDQTPEAAAGDPWQRHADPQVGDHFVPRHGMELSRPAIEALLQAHPQLGEPAERQLYAALGRGQAWGPPDHTHGARVLHLLAGPAHADLAVAAGDRSPEQARRQPGQPATDLPVIFVQLPAQTIADTSGDSLGMQVIDGARYIVGRTLDEAAGRPGWQATLNISLGGIAGPHDGSSLAERALDELARDARVGIVVSAGNAADQQRIHAERRVSASLPGDYYIDLPSGQRQDSFVEWWLPDGEAGMDAFQLTVTPPRGPASAPVSAGQVVTLRDAQGEVLASLVFARRVAQGLNGSLALLALAPTASALSPYGMALRATAAAGIWQVQVRSSRALEEPVHAWVERDDVLVGERSPQLTRFEPDSRLPAAEQYLNDRYTLSSLAHGLNVLRAGATVRSSNALAAYSSQGPSLDKQGPEREIHYAPVDRSPSMPGMAVPGFYSGSLSSMGGTSAAAPLVARRVVETGSASAPDSASLTDPDGRALVAGPAGPVAAA